MSPTRPQRSRYPSQFLIGLMNSASQRGIRLVTELCEAPGQEEATADALIDRGVEGIMLPPPFCDSAQLVQMLAQRSIPTVVLSSSLPHAPASAVGIDDYRAALEMTRHVLSLGHERIGFICGDPAQTISARRLAGYKAAMAEAGIGTIVAQGMDTYRSGLDGAEALLSLDPRLSAIFASNDEMAAAAVACANRLGLDVPSDITVVGFDDAALAMTIWPELTTVHQPILEMAMDGMDVLLRGIRAFRSGEVPVKESILKAHTLIRRRSDAAPRRRPPLRLSNAALNPANRTNAAPE